MKRMKTLRVGILAVLGAVALFGLFGCDIEEIIEAAGADTEAVREVTETYEIAGLLDIEVESSNGAVTIESADTTTVTVLARLRSRADTLEKAEERVNAIVLDMVQTGDKLEIRYRGSDQTEDVRRYSGVSFEITVPMQADVNVDTSNGSIAVRGIEGNFALDTSNGSIDLFDLVGIVHADTSNGHIDVRGFSGVLDLETSNGAIDIDDAEATVDVRTSNGRIEFSGLLVGDNHDLRTSNGSIEIEVSRDASILFDASTSIGGISTNLALVGDTEGRDWEAVLNPPAVQTVELRTSNGSIRIEGR